jgi:hypothetical protein
MSQAITDTKQMVSILQKIRKDGGLTLLTVGLYEKVTSEAFCRASKRLK